MLWLLALLASPATDKPEVCARYDCVRVETVSDQAEWGGDYKTDTFQLRPLDLKVEVTEMGGKLYSTAFVLGRFPTPAGAKMLSKVLSREWGQKLKAQQIFNCLKGVTAGAAQPLALGNCARRGQASVFFRLTAFPH